MSWKDILKQNGVNSIIEALKGTGNIFHRRQGEQLESAIISNNRVVTERLDEVLSLWEKENKGNYEKLAQMIGDNGMPMSYAGKGSVQLGLAETLKELKRRD
jgi:hypothetical protein